MRKRGTESLTSKSKASPKRGLWVPKRRVAARVRLADGTVVEGTLYADVQRLDGTPGSVSDRLEDPLGRFLPVAVEDRHVLLNKSGIVCVELGGDESRQPHVEEASKLGVRVRLSTNTFVEGDVYALLPPAQSRVLDYLNHTTQRFLKLYGSDHLTLVNSDYVVEITEQRGSERG